MRAKRDRAPRSRCLASDSARVPFRVFRGFRGSWHRRDGFTLIEIAAVMAIITMVLAMAVGAHYAWKRWTALDTAQLRAESCFALARQHAVGTGHPAFVALGCGGAPIATNSLDVATFFSEQNTDVASPTNGLAWCCAAEVTNLLDWAEACSLLSEDSASTAPYPIVGPVAVFSPAIRWGDADDPDAAFTGRILLFLPDGSVCDPSDASGTGAALTNVLFGAGAPLGNSPQDAERLAPHRRILVLDSLLGTVRTLPRDGN